jgi:hypothetical protein
LFFYLSFVGVLLAQVVSFQVLSHYCNILVDWIFLPLHFLIDFTESVVFGWGLVKFDNCWLG